MGMAQASSGHMKSLKGRLAHLFPSHLVGSCQALSSSTTSLTRALRGQPPRCEPWRSRFEHGRWSPRRGASRPRTGTSSVALKRTWTPETLSWRPRNWPSSSARSFPWGRHWVPRRSTKGHVLERIQVEGRGFSLLSAFSSGERGRFGGFWRGRKLFVSNLRSKDGRRLEPKLTMLDSTGKRWMTLTKRDFEQIMKCLEPIRHLFIYLKRGNIMFDDLLFNYSSKIR